MTVYKDSRSILPDELLIAIVHDRNTAQLKKQPTDHLLMDLTMFIHRSMKADMVVERSLNSSVVASIKSLVQSYKPRQSLFIAIDGAAPIAKLPVQILRRAQYFDKNVG